MFNKHRIEKNILIITFENNELDLSSIEQFFDSSCKHLIFDLREVLHLNIQDLIKFTKFGKNLVKINSFVMISSQFFDSDFLVVRTLQEAFDIIDMEDIERLLKI